MKVKFQTINGVVFELSIGEKDSVEAIKKQISDEHHFVFKSLKLLHNGKFLKNSSKLSDLNIKEQKSMLDYIIVDGIKKEVFISSFEALKQKYKPISFNEWTCRKIGESLPKKSVKLIPKFVEMGFKKEMIEQCLIATNGDVNLMTEYLTKGLPEEEIKKLSMLSKVYHKSPKIKMKNSPRSPRKMNFYFRTGSCSFHSFFFYENKLFGFGLNAFGQLGNGENEKVNPSGEQIPFKYGRIKQISCGGLHTVIVTMDRKTYSFGRNESGQLGHGDTNDRNVIVEIKFFGQKKVFDAVCGSGHSLWKTNDGYYSCGSNSNGCLGINENVNEFSTPKPIKFSNKFKIQSIVAGMGFTIFLCTTGVIYKSGKVWGEEKSNYFPKRVLFFTQNDPILQHSAGLSHYLCVTKSNRLFAFGSSSHGQSGLGSSLGTVVFQEITFFHGLANIKSFSCGAEHSYVLLENGRLCSFGKNKYGQLGIGNDENKYTPTKIKSKIDECVGNYSSGFISNTKGYIFCVGKAENGELGNENLEDLCVFTRNIYIESKKKRIILGNKHGIVSDDVDDLEIPKIILKLEEQKKYEEFKKVEEEEEEEDLEEIEEEKKIEGEEDDEKDENGNKSNDEKVEKEEESREMNKKENVTQRNGKKRTPKRTPKSFPSSKILKHLRVSELKNGGNNAKNKQKPDFSDDRLYKFLKKIHLEKYFDAFKTANYRIEDLDNFTEDIPELQVIMPNGVHRRRFIREVRKVFGNRRFSFKINREELNSSLKRGIKYQKYAFVIGNEKYISFGKLNTCKSDAENVSNLLKKQGFNVCDKYDVNGDDFLDAWNSFLIRTRKGIQKTPNVLPLVVVFFAGHGVYTEDDQCLLATDFDKSLFEIIVPENFSTLEDDEKDDLLERRKKKAKEKVREHCIPIGSMKFHLKMLSQSVKFCLFIDACRSKVHLEHRFSVKNFEELPTKGWGNITHKNGSNSPSTTLKTAWVVSYSTQMGKVAYDGSHYSKSLVKNLKRNYGKGKSVVEILYDVRDEVYEKSNKNQEPIIETNGKVNWI